MKLLAIDTAMAACSAAVIDKELGKTLARRFLAMERGHAEALAPMVKEVMAEARISFDSLDRIAVTTGPGTFTGVRVGLSFARGLGLALACPVIGIDTLSAIAANIKEWRRPLLVAADARNCEVYTARFDAIGVMLRQPTVESLDVAGASMPANALVIGTGADRVMFQGKGDLERSPEGDLPDASKFAWIAAKMPPSAGMPSPLYLRAPDAKSQATTARKVVAFQTAGIEAADILATLHGECFDNPWDRAAMCGLLAMPGASAILASENLKPVAFALVRSAANEAEILTLGTRPFARGHGIATELVRHVLREFQAAGIASVFIEVAKGNEPARALYGKSGFAEAGMRKDYYARGNGQREDAIVMRKSLGP